MLRTATKLVLALALGATPVVVLPTAAHAQTDAQQRAYQAGYQNGMNDRSQGKSLNLKTDNWHGVNLSAYQRGYEQGYRNAGRNNPYAGAYGEGQYGQYGDHDRDDRDRNNGYYGNNGGYYGNGGYVGGPYSNGAYENNGASQRAYQAGYQNGVNDRSRNKPLNLRTDNWHGANLSAYQQGYEAGYNGGRRGHRHDRDDDR
ncbi:MAG TPA: hypothetical protein VKW78_00950 [Terriglobales bacterium]|nr:hypothetical protein [Terriglobales bacterium]